MLRAAIIGCGKIADSHISQILRIPGCKIVGVCDREPLMARQLSERFRVGKCYGNVQQLLSDGRPTVVHITTPPASHFDLARTCLQSGCHVYVEKPFTVHEHEAQELVRIAEQRGVRITVGHDDQFSHVARRMRALVQSGYLGGRPVHIESYYGYEMGRAGYAGAVLADPQHWVRKLPGKLLHNIISHGIARIAEFLTCDFPRVIAHGFTSPFLREMGETELVDELRTIIYEEGGSTAYFTFSSQMRPSLHLLRLYGPKNGLVLDQDEETLIKFRGGKYKSYLEKFIPPITTAKQEVSGSVGNLRRFLRMDFHMKSGMKYLIESFYRSIVNDSPVPIPYREIILTARIMDAVFAQLGTERPDPDQARIAPAMAE